MILRTHFLSIIHPKGAGSKESDKIDSLLPALLYLFQTG